MLCVIFICLLSNLRLISAKQMRQREFCGEQDITDFPREGTMQLDGIWYTHRISTDEFLPVNSILLYQFQGRIVWGNEWNPKTRKCTFRKTQLTQNQTVEFGPFTPCQTAKLLLPEEVTFEGGFIHFQPTKNLLMFYQCSAVIRPDQSCSQTPFFQILSKRLDISLKELNIFEKQLNRLGTSLKGSIVVNPRTNGCPVPMQTRRKYRTEPRKN